MTKFYFNVIIALEDGGIGLNFQRRNIIKGGTAKSNYPNSSLLHQVCVSGGKKSKMQERYENLKEAAEYLIEFFNATNQKYSCARTKIGKLLSIVAFKFARNDIQIFKENIYKYNDCGTIIEELKSHFDMEIYLPLNSADNNVFIGDDCSDIDSQKYKISDSLKYEIRDVFRNFGAFDPYYLGQCINHIINSNNIVKGKIVDLSLIKSLNIEDFVNVETHRELIDYLLK